MSVRMKFYRNGDGNLQVESAPASTGIGRFLIEDVQGSPAACREILMIIEGIYRDEMASWRRVGNAHTLILSKNEAVVESLFASPGEQCRLSLEDFREIITNWLHFLEG